MASLRTAFAIVFGGLGGVDVVGPVFAVESDQPGGDRATGFGSSTIAWRGDLDAYRVAGAINTKWTQLGGTGGRLGYPVSDERVIPIGLRSDFQGGYIIWTASTDQARAYVYLNRPS